jgi:hypothetical protein
MNREKLRERLDQAERNIADARRHVGRLRELVAELQRSGSDLRLATNLLHQFEHRLATYIAERDRLRKELGL